MSRALGLGLLLLSVRGLALEVPALSGRINDRAGLLAPGTAAELEALLKDHEKRTSEQVAVLTLLSLEGESLEGYSHRVASAWKLGQKGRNNGVLLLIAKDDRKLRIEVGYGLEARLNDGLCGQIIREQLTPRFKTGDFNGGVAAGVRAILAAAEGKPLPAAAEFPGVSAASWDPRVIFQGRWGDILLVLAAVFLIVWGATSDDWGLAMVSILFSIGILFVLGCLVGFWTAVGSLVISYPAITLFAEYAAKVRGRVKRKGRRRRLDWFERFIQVRIRYTLPGGNIFGGPGGGGGGSPSFRSSAGGGGSSFSGGGGSFGGGGASGSW